MIVSLVQTKGGTGKTTLSQCLAHHPAISAGFDSVALVEMDPQGNLKRWWQERLSFGRPVGNVCFFHVVETDPDRFKKRMEPILNHHRLILMDVPGESVSRFHTGFACTISDHVMIPMRTSTHDEDAFEANLWPIIHRIQSRGAQNHTRFSVIPSFTHPLTRKGRLTAYFRDRLPDGIACLEAVFPFRMVYENYNRQGYTLDEYARAMRQNRREYQQACKAVKDIEEIARELLKGMEDHGHIAT